MGMQSKELAVTALIGVIAAGSRSSALIHFIRSVTAYGITLWTLIVEKNLASRNLANEGLGVFTGH